MLPIRDDNPTHLTPFVNWTIIVVAALAFFVVQPGGELESLDFLYAQATIPCEVVTGEPLSRGEVESGECIRGGVPIFADKSVGLSLVVSIFLHGGFGHLFGNLWILWIFGNNIEDEMGHVRYLAFYLVSGVVATLAHVVLQFGSTVPVVGASGAIAGVMGAYLVLHPAARVTSIIPPLFFLPFRVPAAVFLVIWFLGQFALAGGDSNIAWEAHVGGFVVGAVYAWRLRRSRQDVDEA
jgi:membrane associated rhomboid family serine protease